MLILLKSIDIFNLLEKLFIFIDFTNVEYLFNTYYDKDNGKKKNRYQVILLQIISLWQKCT